MLKLEKITVLVIKYIVNTLSKWKKIRIDLLSHYLINSLTINYLMLKISSLVLVYQDFQYLIPFKFVDLIARHVIFDLTVIIIKTCIASDYKKSLIDEFQGKK